MNYREAGLDCGDKGGAAAPAANAAAVISPVRLAFSSVFAASNWKTCLSDVVADHTVSIVWAKRDVAAVPPEAA